MIAQANQSKCQFLLLNHAAVVGQKLRQRYQFFDMACGLAAQTVALA